MVTYNSLHNGQENDMKDGGPAFPYVVEEEGCETAVNRGMTLRDYIAAHAPEPPEDWWGPGMWRGSAAGHALWRYQYADAMLAAREAK
jgi:hypothetical protein